MVESDKTVLSDKIIRLCEQSACIVLISAQNIEMDLNLVKYFSKVAQVGSFTKAAEALGIPKSTLSEKISELESDLKVSLLVRTTRKLTLTDAGKDFLTKVTPALEQIVVAHDEVKDQSKPLSGHIRMTVLADFADSKFVEIIADFRAAHPEIEIDIDFNNQEVDFISSGYDFAIRGGTLQDSSLMSRHLGTSKFVLVASKRYLAKNGTPKMPKDIETHVCLKMGPVNRESKWILRDSVGKKASINVANKPGCGINSMLVLRKLALLDQGVALIPLFLVKKELENEKLVRVLPEWYMAPQAVHMIYPKVKYLSARVKELLNYIEKNLRGVIE